MTEIIAHNEVEKAIGDVWLDLDGGHEEQQLKAILQEYGCDEDALLKFRRGLTEAGHIIIPTELTEARLQSILDAMRRAVTEANHIDWRTVAMAAHDEITKGDGA